MSPDCKRRVWLLPCCAILVITAAVSSSGSKVVYSPHPTLFFNIWDVPDMQVKARTSHQAIAERIIRGMGSVKRTPESYLPPRSHGKFTSKWNEKYGNDLCTLAMYCVLYPEDREALQLVHEFMERLAAQPSWEYSKMAQDEMPISHSLVGMAVAYDFLYPTLGINERRRYFKRIRKATGRHFERFKSTSWGEIHHQNHIWNNNVALLIGAVVTSVHDPRAEEWVHYVVRHLNISMNMFNLIVDGSYDEGVSYSTYTTRSLAMFAHIMDRRYNIQEYYQSHWLRKHFWYMYRTLIGYKETVGIADSNPTWFYGPEAMLVFLDKFVLRNGYGNWLASRIREHRSSGSPSVNFLAPSYSQRLATYHLEFIWYDETLGEVSPDTSGEPALFLFPDWGVVTYGGGLPANNTFFSFKSGYVHGRAINAAVNKRDVYQEYVSYWNTLNPGHEHPDQLSFTFWPNGQPFITDSYYGPKFSFLNNVLMFAPSTTARCFPPFEGQLAECSKWLRYWLLVKDKQYADIVASYKQGQYSFVSGEAAGSYGRHLGIRSVYRSVILLAPDVLAVIDHVQLLHRSKLTKANAFFNMRQGQLEVRELSAVLRHSGQEFHVAWAAASGAQTTVNAAAYKFPCEYGTRQTLVLNVSLTLQQGTQPNRMAYIFYKGDPARAHVDFTSSTYYGYAVKITVNGVTYDIAVATEHADPAGRLYHLGHTGFASVTSGLGKRVTFGYRPTGHAPTIPTVLVSSMRWSGARVIAGALNASEDFTVATLKTLQTWFAQEPSISAEEMCRWKPGSDQHMKLPEWLYNLYQSALHSQTRVKLLQPFSSKHGSPVVLANYGQMDSKLSLLPRSVSVKVVHVLRDPRSWVAFALKTPAVVSTLAKSLKSAMNNKSAQCLPVDISPIQQKLLDHVDNYLKGSGSSVELLALYWVSHVLPVLEFQKEASDRLHIVWLEELLLHPEATGERIVEEFLGLPLSPASRHYLLQRAHSNAYTLPSTGELLNQGLVDSWKKVLSSKEIRAVENVYNEYLQGHFLAALSL